MRSDYASKVSAMTGLPAKIVDRLCELESMVILDSIYLEKDSTDPIIVPIHDFGDLIITKNGGEVDIQFRVSTAFSKKVQKALESVKSPTVVRAEELLIKKLMKYYKEIV